MPRADPRRPQLRDLGDALLDHRHRRLLRNAHRGALHPLVPVRRLLPDLPYSRTSAEGALRIPVERAGQGQHAGRRQPALPADAVYLFSRLDGDEPGLHDHACLPGVPTSRNDTKVYGITDQYMFGPALLVNPVTATGATSRSVYLPAGTWYDFCSGSTTTGGSTSTASAPLVPDPPRLRPGSGSDRSDGTPR